MKIDEWLDFVEQDDKQGLLKEKVKSNKPTPDETLVNRFNEICDFKTSFGREPTEDKTNINEWRLFKRLSSIRNNLKQCNALLDFDIHNLLPITAQVAESSIEYQVEPKKIETIDDIFDDDDLGLLNDESDSIFTIRNVPKVRTQADEIARRKKCDNFENYKEQFKTVHQEITAKKRLLRPFTDKGEALLSDNYYVLNGVLLYLEEVELTSDERTVEGKRFRKDGRTYCVFENGTESRMLYRSLAKELYKDGKIVSESNEHSNTEFYKNFHGIESDDTATGYVYVLESLSVNQEIRSIEHLYKIGYSTTSIEKRIANASKEPTYLMAPVKIVTGYQCFNMNAQKFENLIHTFFGKACLDIEITDEKGQLCRPREWFKVPIESIESAIQLVLNGDIINYRYDSLRQAIVEK